MTDGTCSNRGPHGSPSPETGTSFGRARLGLASRYPQIQIPEEDGACHGMERFPERRSHPPTANPGLQPMLLFLRRRKMEPQAGPSDDSLVSYQGFFFGFFRFENGMGLMYCTLGRNYWHSGWQEINPVPFSIPQTGLAGSAKRKYWMLPPDRL